MAVKSIYVVEANTAEEFRKEVVAYLALCAKEGFGQPSKIEGLLVSNANSLKNFFADLTILPKPKKPEEKGIYDN